MDRLISAGCHDRTGKRTAYRNGYRDRTLDTRPGSLQLRIPKLQQGSCSPPFLAPRKTSEKAFVAVIQEAWVSGVLTRRMDDLVQVMGLSSISKSHRVHAVQGHRRSRERLPGPTTRPSPSSAGRCARQSAGGLTWRGCPAASATVPS